jgi:hypothetical protein
MASSPSPVSSAASTPRWSTAMMNMRNIQSKSDQWSLMERERLEGERRIEQERQRQQTIVSQQETQRQTDLHVQHQLRVSGNHNCQFLLHYFHSF